jgi:serine/threonine protein kinase
MEPLATGDPVRIGPFRLVARLGRGGMGRVYLGRAESTGRAVAVKTIHGQLLVDPEFRIRFSHEVAAARRVRDEYIAEVVDADPDGATPWLATAYVPGISLEDAVRRFGPLPADSVRLLGVCVDRAVAAIHGVGLVHRDLKPSNVLLTAAGPKVIDFGIARGVSEAGLTKTGMVSGSPPYMAPEQLARGVFGPGSDMFSLAAILHYAATTAGPYGRGGAQEQFARALAVGPLMDPALPDVLADVIGRCFVADPNARPAAGEVARSLEAHQSERPGPGWLPHVVVSDILTQATDALNKDSAAGFAPARPQPRDRPPSQPQPIRQPQPPMQPQPDPQLLQQQPLVPPPIRPVQPAQPRVQTPPAFTPTTPAPQYPQHQNTPHSNTLHPNTPYPNTPRPNTAYQSTPPPNASFPRPYQPQPQYPMQSVQPQVPYGYQPARPDNNTAVTALVLALVGIVVPCLTPIALPFGIVGLSRARKTGGVGHGQALAAVIVSSFLLACWVVLVAVGLSFS